MTDAITARCHETKRGPIVCLSVYQPVAVPIYLEITMVLYLVDLLLCARDEPLISFLDKDIDNVIDNAWSLTAVCVVCKLRYEPLLSLLS